MALNIRIPIAPVMSATLVTRWNYVFTKSTVTALVKEAARTTTTGWIESLYRWLAVNGILGINLEATCCGGETVHLS